MAASEISSVPAAGSISSGRIGIVNLVNKSTVLAIQDIFDEIQAVVHYRCYPLLLMHYCH
jgi:hypothetical protein